MPVNVDPLASALDDPDERRRLARLLERGSASPPATSCRSRLVRSGGARRRAAESPRWRSSPWPLRREHLYLIAGRLAHGVPAAARHAALGAARGRGAGLPARPVRRACGARRSVRRCGDAVAAVPRMPPRDPSPRDVVHTALCVEAREGRLHVFMPPLDPVRGLPGARRRGRATAAAALRLAGDARGLPAAVRPAPQVLAVTPDPGVIEVNVHPSALVARARRDDRHRSTRRRGSAVSAPRSSCSTAVTPAPAAATT